jgi:hypothetical protein
VHVGGVPEIHQPIGATLCRPAQDSVAATPRARFVTLPPGLCDIRGFA